MKVSYFGATQVGSSRPIEDSCAPITQIKCFRCLVESPVEYVVWGNRDATEADNEEAIAFFARLIREGHPEHKPIVYGACTLEELGEQLWRKLAGLFLADSSAPKHTSQQETL